MPRILSVPVLAVLAMLASACGDATAANDGAQPQITVSGSTTIRLRPDYVRFTFQAMRQGREVQPLKDEVDAVTNRAVAALSAFDIAETDFTSSGVSVQRRYEYIRDRGQVFAGFTVSRDYTLKVRDIARYEEVVDALTRAGIEDLGNPTVQLDDEEAHQREAVAAAARVAHAKARALADALDVDLGPAIHVTEDGVQPQFQMRGRPEAMAQARDSGGVPEMTPDDFSVTANVRVTFAIED